MSMNDNTIRSLWQYLPYSWKHQLIYFIYYGEKADFFKYKTENSIILIIYFYNN